MQASKPTTLLLSALSLISSIASISLLLWLSAVANAAELEAIGSFDFPTSGSPEAQKHFILGTGYLHSFGWKQAQDEFRRAQELEPDFAMAYWGEVFIYNHPFIGELDTEGPKQTLLRLGPTPEIRLSKAPTEWEKGFLKAAVKEAKAYLDDNG